MVVPPKLVVACMWLWSGVGVFVLGSVVASNPELWFGFVVRVWSCSVCQFQLTAWR
jgi:hypothetical protein